jgi:glycosyltransferase involved in cell wall biosynthesis
MTRSAADIAVVTNAQAAQQMSMLGYGELVLEAARAVTPNPLELRASSKLSVLFGDHLRRASSRKLLRDAERYVISPLSLAGKRANIVHVIDPGNSIYLQFMRYRKSIVTVHDTIPYHCLAGNLSGFRPSRLGALVMKLILRELQRVDRIVCVSEATRQDLLDLLPLDAARVLTIPNAVFQPMTRAPEAERNTLRAELGIPVSAPLILHVGRNFYKNRKTVLEVFANLRRSHPTAILAFVSEETPELREKLETLSLKRSVRFLGLMPQGKMPALYSTASILLFPSLYEGFGYPVIEAQLCGTPVVASNAGSLPEVAGKGALLFAPHDTAGMARAMKSLLEDSETADRLIVSGHLNAQRFSKDRWFDAHARLYHELGTDNSSFHQMYLRKNTACSNPNCKYKSPC